MTKEFTVEVGKTVVIFYGPKILRKLKILLRKVHAELHFTIVTNFYQAEYHEKVFEALSRFLDNYRIKDVGRNYLKIGKNNYEYLLSITPNQDFVPLIELNGYFPLGNIGALTMEELPAFIYASSARLFLWSSSTGYKMDVEELEAMITEVYNFYKEFNLYMHDLMKDNIFGAIRMLLYLSLRKISNVDVIKKVIDKINKDPVCDKFRVDLNKNKLEVLIDDFDIIGKLIKALGG